MGQHHPIGASVDENETWRDIWRSEEIHDTEGNVGQKRSRQKDEVAVGWSFSHDNRAQRHQQAEALIAHPDQDQVRPHELCNRHVGSYADTPTQADHHDCNDVLDAHALSHTLSKVHGYGVHNDPLAVESTCRFEAWVVLVPHRLRPAVQRRCRSNAA